ncbi:MAG: hypothetical protein BRC45_06445 [Cyanobacteria bacterium QS_5_48_63]|nr:MAG: hypothetical protein BRC45_06445 [Cyanobacteria bacterium QS_5_48_63]
MRIPSPAVAYQVIEKTPSIAKELLDSFFRFQNAIAFFVGARGVTVDRGAMLGLESMTGRSRSRIDSEPLHLEANRSPIDRDLRSNLKSEPAFHLPALKSK